jgi:hypothetical protein
MKIIFIAGLVSVVGLHGLEEGVLGLSAGLQVEVDSDNTQKLGFGVLVDHVKLQIVVVSAVVSVLGGSVEVELKHSVDIEVVLFAPDHHHAVVLVDLDSGGQDNGLLIFQTAVGVHKGDVIVLLKVFDVSRVGLGIGRNIYGRLTGALYEERGLVKEIGYGLTLAQMPVHSRPVWL